MLYISSRCIHVWVVKGFAYFFCAWISVLKISFECGDQCCVDFFCVCILVLCRFFYVCKSVFTFYFVFVGQYLFHQSHIFTISSIPCYTLNTMDVEIFTKNRIVPLVLCVKDAIVVIRDLTLSTNFKLRISSILLEK